MRTVLRCAVGTVALLTLAAICWADSLSDGRALYKSGDYAGAVKKLEQAAREQPNNAHVWWQLNFAYNKMRNYPAALNAVQQAGKLDPSHAFASDPGKYNDTITRLQGKVSGGASPAAGASASSGRRSGRATGNDQLVNALMTNRVYVAPGMTVDAARLTQVASELQPTDVRFAVFNSASNANTLAREAERIRDHLSITNGFVIVGSRKAVAAAGPGLDRQTLQRLTKQVAPMMETGQYTQGLEQLARSLVATKHNKAEARTALWVFIGAGVVGLIVVIWVIRSAGRRGAMKRLRDPIERQKSEVVRDLNQLDDGLHMVDTATAASIRQIRLAAGSKLDEAARLLARAKTPADLNRAQSLLDQAAADIAQGKALMNRGMGGSGTPPPTGGSAPGASAGAATSPATDWQSVPDNQRGVCFFCSRPALLSELTPVTVNLNGGPQKVLACSNDLATIRTGQMPQIRAFNENGRYVPWYAAQDYNPYRDYYNRGYDSRDFMSDMITLSLIDHMFWDWHRPMGWGWGGGYGYGGFGNTYVFYPDHDYYRDYRHDYYGGEAASYADLDRPQDAGGADFLQGTGGDYEGGGDLGGNFGADQS